MFKKQRQMDKVMYDMFFRSTEVVKAANKDGQKTVTAL